MHSINAEQTTTTSGDSIENEWNKVQGKRERRAETSVCVCQTTINIHPQNT